MDDSIKKALSALDPAKLSYQEWIEVGMAIKSEGGSVDDWDAWSTSDPRHKANDCSSRWNTFSGNGITGATIIHYAQIYGSLWHREAWENGGVMDWSDEILYDGDDPSYVAEPEEWNPVEDLRTYLRTLFDPDDRVSYVVSAIEDEDGKWKPASRGFSDRTAAQLLRDLDRYSTVEEVIGDWEPAAGAWIRFNPVDGEGVKNENITRFRYALVESDSMELAEQEATMRRLELPIATMVASGGKSIHAIVRVDAANADEYRQRVERLYDFLDANGLTVDRQNRNPARLSRMPGVTRNGKKQFLIATNIGRRSWSDWLDYVDGVEDELPPIVSLAEYAEHPPELKPELIEGILRRGHKMLISGSSKAGKSFLLMELCIALAYGGRWLGFQCRRSRVLYVNLEIDEASCVHRFMDIYAASGHDPAELSDRISVWHLRGKAMPMDALVPKLIRRMKNHEYDAVIIDPIYKVITGDENNASEMGAFCNQFDRIAESTGCSVIYCHHHSKGAQGAKRAIDRASGSGVFARDPDAQLDLIQLVISDHLRNHVAENPDSTAWRIETSLREFANAKPVNIWFDYPIHRMDESGELETAKPEGSAEANLSTNWKAGSDDEREEMLDDALLALSIDDHPSVTDVATYLDTSERTVRNWIKRTDKYEIRGGMVFYKTT